MSKAIKVDDNIYEELDKMKLGRQTYSDVIADLLMARMSIIQLLNALEGSLRYREWQREQLEKAAAAAPDRSSYPLYG